MELLYKKFLIEIIIVLENEPLAFNEIQNKLKIYSDTLSRRLKELEKSGLIEASITQEDKGKRVRYKLTQKGNNIAPLIIEAMRTLEKAEESI